MIRLQMTWLVASRLKPIAFIALLLGLRCGCSSTRPRRGCRTSRSTGARRARAAQAEPLYRTDDGHFQFKYLPAFAVLAIPIGVASAAASRSWSGSRRRSRCWSLLLQMSRRLPSARRKPLRWLHRDRSSSSASSTRTSWCSGRSICSSRVVATAALLAMRGEPRGRGRSARRAGDRDQALRRAVPAVARRRAADRVDRDRVAGLASRCSCRLSATASTAPSRCTANGGER